VRSILFLHKEFSYIPPMLPDELLYSWVGRLLVLNSWGTRPASARMLFGGTSKVAIDLPTQLDAMRLILGSSLPCDSVAALVDASTLLPYYRTFLDPRRYTHVLEAMLYGSALALRSRLGLPAHRFEGRPQLRFCPICVAEDVREFSCFYWHRQHHLPEVTCCIRHNIILEAYRDEDEQDRCVCYPGRPVEKILGVAPTPVQLSFAESSHELLEIPIYDIDPAERSKIYKEEIFNQGYGIRKGQVAYPELVMAIREYYQDFSGLTCQQRLLSTTSSPLRWLRDILERPQRYLHPICHILLIKFLFRSISNFRDISNSTNSLSRTNDEDSSLLPKKSHVKGCVIDTQDLLLNNSLSCREVARRTGKCVNTIVSYRRRLSLPIKERPKKIDAFKKLAISRGLAAGQPIAKLASDTGFSCRTIYRVLDGSFQERGNYKVKLLQSELRKRRRNWMLLLDKSKGLGISKAKAARPADYAWLYRNDRTWLLKANSSRRKSHRQLKQVDWEERDKMLCLKINATVSSILQISPPQRVSSSRILSMIGDPSASWSSKRMPNATSALRSLSESVSDFKRRRVDYAINLLGPAANLWEVKRFAGFRVWPEDLLDYLQQQLHRRDSSIVLSANHQISRQNQC